MSHDNKFQWIVGVVIVTATIGIMLIGILDVNLRYTLAGLEPTAPAAHILAAPAVTPVADIAALQQALAAQQAQIDALSRRLKNAEERQAKDAIDIRWLLDSKLLIAGALASIAALLGWNAYNSIDVKVRERIRAVLDQELFQFDPVNTRVWIPAGRGLDVVHQRLTLSGIKNIRWYRTLNRDNYEGVTIVALASDKDELDFIQFLKDNHGVLDAGRAAFILYAPGYQIQRLQDMSDLHVNLTPAQTPVTVVSALLAVGRGLKKTAQSA